MRQAGRWVNSADLGHSCCGATNPARTLLFPVSTQIPNEATSSFTGDAFQSSGPLPAAEYQTQLIALSRLTFLPGRLSVGGLSRRISSKGKPPYRELDNFRPADLIPASKAIALVLLQVRLWR